MSPISIKSYFAIHFTNWHQLETMIEGQQTDMNVYFNKLNFNCFSPCADPNQVFAYISKILLPLKLFHCSPFSNLNVTFRFVGFSDSSGKGTGELLVYNRK